MDLCKDTKDRVSGWWSIVVAMPVHMRLLGAVFLVLLALFLCVVFSENPKWVFTLLGISKGTANGISQKYEALKFLGIGMGGILLVVQALASYKRAKAMEDTAKEQANAVLKTEKGQRQERLKNAIEHLGHNSDSVRLGGAYELFHLAKDTEELRQTVLDILCAHIRRTTGESKYREAHKSKPSEEVQSLLTLLFVQKHAVFKGLRANLQGSWLNGANLWKARLQGAEFHYTQLQGAMLHAAQLQGAKLHVAQLQGAVLDGAQLQGAGLWKVQLQGAMLHAAQLQGAGLDEAQLQGAVLHEAQLQGVGLFEAQLQGAVLFEAQLQGAVLSGAQLQGAMLHAAQLQGAVLDGAQLQGAVLDGAQLQGAMLHEAQLQGAVLLGAQLQGAESGTSFLLEHFEARIRKLIGKKSDLSSVVFAGELSRQGVDSFVEGLSDEKARKLREILESHIGQPPSHELPKNSSAVTGAYTKEEAERWITEYKQAMSKVPRAGDS